jgi:tryptophan synthase beta chain
MKIASNLEKDKIIIVNLSGRGDKDMESVSKFFTNQLI